MVTKQGAIYGTLADGNGVYLFQNGKKRQVAEGIASPAALALWPDGETLVVGDAGDKYLYAFRMEQNGNLDAKERYYPFWVRPKQPSDNAGLTLDATGRAYATSREGLQMFDPTGRLSGIISRRSGRRWAAWRSAARTWTGSTSPAAARCSCGNCWSRVCARE